MKGKILLIGASVFALMLGSGTGHAVESSSCSNVTHSCKATDSNPYVVEPILTRSDAAIVTTETASLAQNGLCNANIQGFTIKATGGNIVATITTKCPQIRSVDAAVNVLPYSGQHTMLMFQTQKFQEDQIIGQDALGADVHWGPPGYNADKFRWFLYSGYNLSENRELCGLGYYDPTGQIVSPIPVTFGQVFFIIGQPGALNVQQPTATCTYSGNTMTVTIPYTYKYSGGSGLLLRRLAVVLAGQTISNTSAFAWLDHEIGGPDPVGLIIGYTWYNDAVPSNSYRYGLIAGDPNPSVFPGPKCLTNPDPNPVTGEPAGPCTIDNPVGTGFVNTGLSFVAG